MPKPEVELSKLRECLRVMNREGYFSNTNHEEYFERRSGMINSQAFLALKDLFEVVMHYENESLIEMVLEVWVEADALKIVRLQELLKAHGFIGQMPETKPMIVRLNFPKIIVELGRRIEREDRREVWMLKILQWYARHAQGIVVSREELLNCLVQGSEQLYREEIRTLALYGRRPLPRPEYPNVCQNFEDALRWILSEYRSRLLPQDERWLSDLQNLIIYQGRAFEPRRIAHASRKEVMQHPSNTVQERQLLDKLGLSRLTSLRS